MATAQQIDLINKMAKEKGFQSARAAAVEYGFDASVSLDYMSSFDADGLIEWLVEPVKSADALEAERERALKRAEERAAETARINAQKHAEIEAARQAKWDADADIHNRMLEIIEERGIGHLTGRAKQDARYEIKRALKAGEIS